MTSSRVGTLAWAERTGGILSRRERIGLLGDAARLQMRILPAQTRALLGRTNPRAFSVDPDRLRVPDTTIAREAEALCSEVSTQALLNHCLRSYAWGTILAERDGLEHDPELFYVTLSTARPRRHRPLPRHRHRPGLFRRHSGDRRPGLEPGARLARASLHGPR
jgi:hypothetical protein